MRKQPAFASLRDAMKKKQTRREKFLAEMGRCQTDANSCRFLQVRQISVGAEAAPLGESGGAVHLVNETAGKGSFRVEEVVDRGAD